MNKSRLIAAVLLLGGIAGAQSVRIGVFGLFHAKELTVAPAQNAALVLEVAGESVALENRAARLRISTRRIEVAAGSRSWYGQRVLVHARDGSASDFVLSVPGKIRREYHGVLEIVPGSSELVPVVSMELELAVASAVAAESPPGAPLEALKAQAVATRSFYVAHANAHSIFDFCDSTHCQFLRQPPPENSLVARAVRETHGIVLTYRGAAFAAMFASSCGGRTRSLAELGLPLRDYPYFAVECPYCRSHAETWTRELPVRVEGERGRLEVARQRGWSALPSNSYRIREQGGVLIADGSGQGHGLGLCQKGAAAMARDGKTFREILDHYYPNTVVTTAALASR
jgi:stage II sporulation protein D